MADGSDLRLFGDWKDLERALSGDLFRMRLERQLEVANKRIGLKFQANARKLIRAGAYAPNSPITIILKGSSKPLVDRGDLFQSITWDRVDAYTIRVGVIKRRLKGDGDALDVAWILHEGATVDVGRHPQVRRAVWAKIRERLGKVDSLRGRQREAVVRAAAAIGAGKRGRLTQRQLAYLYATGKITRPTSTGGGGRRIWVTPGRPFIGTPLADPAFARFAVEQWSAAVKRTLREL